MEGCGRVFGSWSYRIKFVFSFGRLVERHWRCDIIWKKRQIRVVNKCEFCDEFDETEVHIFFGCEFSRVFWFGMVLQINMMNMGARDFLEGWQRLVEKMEKETDAALILQQGAFRLWRIWKCRNEVVFTGNHILPYVVVDLWR